ncbi:MAG: hypothetical protein PHY12_05080 [Eubacteriales bacterium]|nr:hypothetical protein [Eubacteriales bacterium]
MEKFVIELYTIFGARKGTMSIERSGEAVSGEIDLLGRRNPFQGSRLSDLTLSLHGELKGIYRPLAYTMSCKINDHTISGVLNTAGGHMRLRGVQDQHEEDT